MRKITAIAAVAAIAVPFVMAMPSLAESSTDSKSSAPGQVYMEIGILKAIDAMGLTKDQMIGLAAALKGFGDDTAKLEGEREKLLFQERELLLAPKVDDMKVAQTEKDLKLLGDKGDVRIRSFRIDVEKVLTRQQLRQFSMLPIGGHMGLEVRVPAGTGLQPVDLVGTVARLLEQKASVL